MKRHLLLAGLLVGCAATGLAQNQFHLGQYMVHQPFINPASMTAQQYANGALFYRHQWAGFDGAPVVQGFSFNSPVGKEKKNALGITVIRDQIGVTTAHQIAANYAYKIRTGMRSSLSFGMSATLSLLQSNFTQLNLQQGNDPLFSANTTTFAMPNFRFGMYYHRKGFYAGLSIPNLLENTVVYTDGIAPLTRFDFNAMHYFLHIGQRFNVGNNHQINMSTLVKEVGGAPVQVDVNAQFLYNQRVGFGTSWRSSGEVLGILSIFVMPELMLSYAYEHNYAQIGKFSSGTHEVMLLYRFVPPKVPVVEVPRF
jgi:type IX secretion system PorP/SprF family membrane protein